MRVFVAGHRGMLGHVAARYLSERGFDVVTSAARYDARPDNALPRAIRESGASWVVNALGRIKQKCADPEQLFAGNTLFPLHLRATLLPEQRLIHASTDCVFSGKTGRYSVATLPDPSDDYGLSKWLGERVAEAGRAYVIRTSVIGPECSTQSGLMSWFLAQRGPVNGYVNHHWNGVTTLEWSKMCVELMTGQYTPPAPLFHAGADGVVSKYELLKYIADAWEHRVTINPVEADTAIDRSLALTLTRPPLRQQLSELRQWYQAR